MKKHILVLGLILLLMMSLVVPLSTGNMINLKPCPTLLNDRWTKTYDRNSSEHGNSVHQTSDGGYIIVGVTSSFYSDVWLIKTDSNGNMLWDKTFGGSNDDAGYSVQQTSDGGYIITGYKRVKYGPGWDDVWLIKTNANGEKVWDKTFGGINFEWGRSVQQTLDGGYIIAGFTSSNGDPWCDVWLIKTDINGVEQWNKTFGKEKYVEQGNSVQQTSDGGYIITGLTNYSGNELSDFDIYLIKTDANGEMIWNKTFGGQKYEEGYSVQQTTDQGYIITGVTNSSGAGSYDVCLIKTDANGEKVWDKTFGGTDADIGKSGQQISDGGYIITGYTWSFDARDRDIWLIKTDSSGEMIWNKTFGGQKYEEGYSVQQTSDGGYIITGYTWSFSVDDGGDVWLIKTDSQGDISSSPQIPTLSGPIKFKPNQEKQFIFITKDPENDNISYYVDWGDGTNTGWQGPFNSGESYKASHNWSDKGHFIIKCKAKDIYGYESDWGNLEINIPRTRASSYPNWYSFLEQLPILKQLLQILEQ